MRHGTSSFGLRTLAALLVVACGDPTARVTAHSLGVIGGERQIAAAGSTLAEPATVLVLDADGAPLAGATVAWEVASGGGSVSPATSISDADGLATARWTLGTTLGRQALRVTAGSLPPLMPSAFAMPTAADDVDAGDSHTCAITPQGPACWGMTRDGRLGVQPLDSTVAPWPDDPVRLLDIPLAARPVGVSTGTRLASIAAGDGHTCALDVAGTAFCWGDNGFGEVGDGTTAQRNAPVPVSSGGRSFRRLTSGASRTCALTADGQAYCWGANGNGELGDSTVTSRSLPTPVRGGISFASIHVEGYTTCGRTTIGTVYCWGRGVLVPAKIGGSLAFADISVGWDHACGVTEGAEAYCWALNALGNTFGQLGDGTTGGSTTTPRRVAGDVQYSRIAAGTDFTCALSTSGVTYCWGRNHRGQLGDGATIDRSVPAAVSGGLVFQAISAGHSHVCATRTDGALYCWGDNTAAQLGLGDTAMRRVPQLVFGPGDSLESPPP